MRTTSALATLALAGGVIGLAQLPASADLVTRCVGEGGAVTVPGDLVVPANQSCELTGTTVTGNVRVGAGADLVLIDATVGGNVAVAQNGFLDAMGSSVGGTVTNRAGFGTYLDNTSVGAFTGTGTEDFPNFLLTVEAEVAGRVNVTSGPVVIESSVVDGQLRGRGNESTDVLDSVIGSGLLVTGNDFGSVVCDSEIYGDTRYNNNEYGVQLGGDGPVLECDGASFWGGNVRVDNTTGGVTVTDNIVAGNLSGDGNDPAPVGEGNRVRGTVSGQFADLQPPAATPARMSAQGAPEDRSAELEAAREARLSTAVQKADRAGDAGL